MSRFIISNNEKWHQRTVEIIERSGFRKSFERNGSICITSFKKLIVDNNNVYGDNKSFILSSGTVIYKDKIGTDALSAMLHDLMVKSITEIRSDLIGSYAICFCIDNTIRVITDEGGSYSLYYYAKDNQFIITNTYIHIAECTGCKLDILGFIEKATCSGNVANNTPYSDIFRLNSDEIIEIYGNSFSIKKVNRINTEYKYGTISEAVEDISEKLLAINKIRSDHFHNYFHFVTGGLDSRIELALLLNEKNNIKLGYWTGSDAVTNGTANDAAIGNQIADGENLPYQIFDVSESYQDALQNAVESKNKYGEYAALYSGNSKWFNIFETMDKSIDYIDFGYLCEMVKSVGDLDSNYHENYNLMDQVKTINCRSGIDKCLSNKNDLYQYIYDEYLKAAEGNYEKPLSKDQANKLYELLRIKANSTMCNFVNMYCYSFPVFAQKEVLDRVMSIPYNFKKNNVLSISIIKRLYEKLLDYPVFSHHHMYNINHETCELVPTIKTRIKKTVKQAIYNTFVYDKVYLQLIQKRIKPQADSNKQIVEQAVEIIESSAWLKDAGITLVNHSKLQGLELDSLATLTAYIRLSETGKAHND